jgi:glycine/D-amino acid oxidase-like deaminating enzyme
MTELDVVIVGGGIQGLLVLDVLMERGYSCALVTEGDLGAGQTLHSHGFLNTGFGMLGPELPRAASEIVHPWLRRQGIEPSHNWVVIPPPGALVDLPAAELPPGCVWTGGQARRLPDAVVPKRALVEALAAGSEDRVIRGSIVGFLGRNPVEKVLLRRPDRVGVEELGARAVVVAAGCGTKGLLRQLAGLGPQVERIKHRVVHMLCLRAPCGALPATSVVTMPPGLMVAAHEDARGVTWYVTPMELSGPSFDDVPNDGEAETAPATLARAAAVLLTLFPRLPEVEGLLAGSYAGYRQDIGDGPGTRLCELVEGVRNVVVALPSGLLGAWLNAAEVPELLCDVVGPGGAQPALSGGGEGVRVGGAVEEQPGFAWSSWADWSSQVVAAPAPPSRSTGC